MLATPNAAAAAAAVKQDTSTTNPTTASTAVLHHQHKRIEMPSTLSKFKTAKNWVRAGYFGYKIVQGVRAVCGDLTAVAELGMEVVGWLTLQEVGEMTLEVVAEAIVEGVADLTAEQVPGNVGSFLESVDMRNLSRRRRRGEPGGGGSTCFACRISC